MQDIKGKIIKLLYFVSLIVFRKILIIIHLINILFQIYMRINGANFIQIISSEKDGGIIFILQFRNYNTKSILKFFQYIRPQEV